MSGLIAGSVSGGSVDSITYPLEDTHPIENLQDIEEAIAYASEALDAAQRLEQARFDTKTNDKLANKLLMVAVENYIDRFQIPRAALEANDVVVYGHKFDDEPEAKKEEAKPEAAPAAAPENKPAAAPENKPATAPENKPAASNSNNDEENRPEESNLKKVVMYLYAVVARIFKAIFDFFGKQKGIARKLIPLTRQYIGEADSLSTEGADKLSIKDRSLMNALQIDGVAPKNPGNLYDHLAAAFEKQHAFASVQEVIRLVSAAKEKNVARVKTEAETLRKKLEAGLNATLKEISNPESLAIFKEKKSDAATYFVSEPLFGHNFIFGVVGDRINESGTFRYTCGVRHDEEVELRVETFRALKPDEIRQICRTALKVCETIVRLSRDEELMQKALREATFLTRKESNKSDVVALRNIVAVGQNSYITYLRYTSRTTQALMRWCAVSIKRYRSVETPNG